MLKINLFNQTVFEQLKTWIFDILNTMDSIAWGSFSLLDLALGFLMIGAFLPVVLNLRNVNNAVMSSATDVQFYQSYKQFKSGKTRHGRNITNSRFLSWRNGK